MASKNPYFAPFRSFKARTSLFSFIQTSFAYNGLNFTLMSPMPHAYDRVTGFLQQYASIHAPRLIKKALDLSEASPSIIVKGSTPREIDKSEHIIAGQARLEKTIREICERNNRFRLLILARKTPFSFFSFLWQHEDGLGSQMLSIRYACFGEAALVAANNILKYSLVDPAPQTANDRNTFTPTENELEDAIFLSICAYFHRHNIFYLNTQAHKRLTDESTNPNLIKIYNQRQSSSSQSVDSISNTTDGDVMLGLISIKAFNDNTIRFDFPPGNFLKLVLPSYYPVPFKAENHIHIYDYLAGPDFTGLTGLNFDKFYGCWLALQKLALISLPLQWFPGETYAIDFSQQFMIDRLFDICETGIGSASRKSLIEKAMTVVNVSGNDPDITEDDLATFIDFATCKQFSGNLKFPEQPFLFYDAGNEILLWDYLRNLGFWKSMARDFVTRSGKIGHQKGAQLENLLWENLSALPAVTQLKMNIKITQKDPARKAAEMEADIGFIWNDVLIIIEAKSWFKRIDYYFAHDVEVSDRQQRVNTVLSNIDEKIKRFLPSLGKYWDLNSVRGCLSVVITDEVEFIPSYERTLWLVSGEIPRICLPEEFLNFIRQHDVSAIVNNPSFTDFK